MAAMTLQEEFRTARLLAKRIFQDAVATATLNLDDLVAAVDAVDDAMEGVPTELPNQGQSIALNLNAILPEPFKTTATTPQKSALLGIWAGVKYGLL